MKRFFLLAFVMCAVLLSVGFAQADEYSLDARILTYDPIPAAPGQYVTVTVELKNMGNEDAPDAAIMIEDQFPFSVVSESERLKSIGVLKAQQSYVQEFRLRVDSAAIVGRNPVKITYTGNADLGTWQETTPSIDVKSNDVSLSVTDIESMPEEIVPGSDATVKVTVKNTASVTLRNIAVNLNLFSQSSNAVVDLPFIPAGSATEKQVTRLNPGESTVISFDIKAYPSATPGFYKLPLTASFYDDAGTKTEKTDMVGLVIKAKPELKVLLEETTLHMPQTQGEVTLKFVNKGIHDLKFLDVTLEESDSYDVLSTKNTYIGDLDSDDYRSESFVIKALEEDVDLNVHISYKDTNNNEYETTLAVPLQYNKIAAQNGGGMSTGTVLFLLVVVLVIGYFVRRRIKRRKSHKH